MDALKRLLGFCILMGCIFALIVWTTPSKEEMDARFARYCLTATNTRDNPYIEEQCRLTQVYKMNVTEIDLLLYHYKKSFGYYPPEATPPSEKEQAAQAMLHAHYAAHPDEDTP